MFVNYSVEKHKRVV